MWIFYRELRDIIRSKGKESVRGRKVLEMAAVSEPGPKLTTKTKAVLGEMMNEGAKHSCGLQKCNMTSGEGGQRLMQCSRCKNIWYCTQAHQKKDWIHHKKVCVRSSKKKKKKKKEKE